MKVISIWQPFASLAVNGHKLNETRGWPAPTSLIGQRIGIAATKQIKGEQRAIVAGEQFKSYYDDTQLPDLDDLPRGAVIGSALLYSCDLITEEMIEDTTEEELLYGWWEPGRYAWGLRDPVAFGPYLARGLQGLWEWTPPNGLDETVEAALRKKEEKPKIRRVLQDRKGRHYLLSAPANSPDFPVG